MFIFHRNIECIQVRPHNYRAGLYVQKSLADHVVNIDENHESSLLQVLTLTI